MGGVNKALLDIGGRSIVERAGDILTRVFHEVIIVTNSPEEFRFLGLPVFRDLKPGHGSLGGLYTGLSLCAGSHAFLAACDMPFLNAEIIRYLVGLDRGHDIVVPRIRSRLHPLHAVYSRNCLPHIRALMTEKDLRIINFFHNVDVMEVSESDLKAFDPDFRFLMNINTPKDLENARELSLIIDAF